MTFRGRLSVHFLFGLATLIYSVRGLVLRIATWNLLAPQYARQDKYPWCNKAHLAWEYRQSQIIPKLIELDADVICLQEVQVNAWPQLFSFLESEYDGVLQNVTEGHPVASALLVRKGCSLSIERVESRSRILLAVLREEVDSPAMNRRQTNNRKVYICSVHLEAGMKDDNAMQRYHQVKSVFKRLSHHCRLDQVELADASLVLAGDFNMLQSDIMHVCLSKGELYHPEELKNKPPIPIAPLKDAFLGLANVETGNTLQMTFAGGSVLDYIWLSQNFEIRRPLPLLPAAWIRDPQQWPSEHHPSDHLALGVETFC